MPSSVKTVVPAYQNYINGQWVKSSSGEMFPVYDPSTEEVIAHVAAATVADVDHAVRPREPRLIPAPGRRPALPSGVACCTAWRRRFARMLSSSPSWNAAIPASPLWKRSTTSRTPPRALNITPGWRPKFSGTLIPCPPTR